MEAIFARPTSGNIRWDDIESLLLALGADIEEREGSRVAIIFPDHPPAIFHRPHPSPMTDKGAVAVMRRWLEFLGYKP
ncbi:MAG: type II toxin-antitoxin system HicA family toxin [Caldilineales bacterium]|nr:type II toxin-antitoxin system HicA family toxin [Caldilineales bacterium]MCW5858984.1 type II toxin-antitoxin system HicA family toxin [Caldilineales bacterium]